MPFLTRRHPLLSRALAILACVLLLAAQAVLAGHGHAHEHGHGLGHEHGHEHGRELGDDDNDGDAERPCAICLFKASGHDSAAPPKCRATTALPASRRAWVAAPCAEPVPVRAGHDRQARGPPSALRVR
jgi:hypothetical protein